MESGITMLVHSFIIGLIIYMLMVLVFKQNHLVAENRSIIIGSLILIYMIIFGHDIPKNINPNL
jgi:CBS domain containing-hemolysin-like protein